MVVAPARPTRKVAGRLIPSPESPRAEGGIDPAAVLRDDGGRPPPGERPGAAGAPAPRKEPAMLSVLGPGVRLCDGITRREALRAGGLGLAGLSWPGLLRARESAAR